MVTTPTLHSWRKSRSGIRRIVRYSRTAVAIIGRSKNYQKRFMSSNRINSNNRVHVSPEIFAIIERLVSAVGKDKGLDGQLCDRNNP